MRRVTDRKGFITVEASLVLPVFLICLIALGYYIKIFAIVENVSYSIADEASKAASTAYTTDAAPQLAGTVKSRIQKDTSELDDVKITKARYLYDDGDLDDLILISAEYSVDIKLPMKMGHAVNLTSGIKCRGFTGVRQERQAMSFEEMETEGTWEPVWIFPADGEKYHSAECTYVKANAKELVLTYEVKKKFEPCKLCDAQEAAIGGYVYCFEKNGTVYHRASCRQVKRYTIEIDRSEAEDKGYTPCSKCGG